MITLNKHVKWRMDQNEILICNCKKLIDLKVPKEFEKTLIKLERGAKSEEFDDKGRKLLHDLKFIGLLSELDIRPIKDNELPSAMGILDKELKRTRNNEFLSAKHKDNPEFFIGVFIDSQIIGVICGFPREDYLLISELAVDLRFQRRGFGERLVREFERTAIKRFNKINVGAVDKALGFYKSLEYKPFLLIQYDKNTHSADSFKQLKIIKICHDRESERLEAKIDKTDIKQLENLRKAYPEASFQYIFTKGMRIDHNEQ